MSIGEKFATKNEVEVLRRKLQLALNGATIVQIEAEEIGVTNFTDLADVPSSYAVAGNFAVRVNSTVDALEFAELKGTTNQVIITPHAADYVFSLPQDIHVAATPTFAGMYLESDTIAPFLKLTNESDMARDPIIQFAVGATPVTKFTYGLDDSDFDNLSWCNDDELSTTTVKGAGLVDALGVVDAGNTRIKTHLSEDSLAHVSHFHLPTGAGDNESSGMRGICTDGTYYYIVDSGNHRIKKHRMSDGLFMWAVGTMGAGDDQFDHPYDICTDGTYLYITDRDNCRIKKHLCSTGAYVAKQGVHGTELGNFLTPSGICTDNTYLYITEGSPGLAPLLKKHICATLASVSQISADGHLDNSNLLGICTDGVNLFITNANSGSCTNCIYKYTLALVWVSDYGAVGASDTQFDCPYGICTDNIHLYVADQNNSRIKKHRVSDYGFVSKIGILGNGNDDFIGPLGICITNYVAGADRTGLLLRLHEDGTFFDVWPKLSIYNNLVFREDSVAQVNYVELQASPSIISYTLILPSAAAGAKKHLFSGATNVLDWGQNVDIDGSPEFAGLTLTGFSGVLVAAAGIIYDNAALADLADVYFPSGEPDIGDILTYESGGWTSMPPAGGAATFLDLTDVDEADYVGHEAEFVVVNGTADGLVFSASSVAGHDILSISHTDVNIAAPDVGDVLTYESSGWTAMPPTAGGTHSLWFPDAFPGSPTSQSDHFDDASLDAKWNEFDIAGKVVISEANHHVKFASTSLLNNNAGMWQTLPSGDFTITAKMRTEYSHNIESKYMWWGITLFQDATNNPATSDLLLFHVYQYNNTVTAQVLHWSDYDSYSGAAYNGPTIMVAPFQAIYFRVRRNGTDFYYDLSLDNLSWKQYAGPIAQGSYFTPAEFGITCSQESGVEQYFYCDWIYYQPSDNFLASAVGASISI